jgi:hypothetical protein
MISIPIVILILSVYLFIRNELVAKFRSKLIDRVFSGPNWEKKVEVYRSVSYHRMVLSFKPLKLESFYTEMQVWILNN